MDIITMASNGYKARVNIVFASPEKVVFTNGAGEEKTLPMSAIRNIKWSNS